MHLSRRDAENLALVADNYFNEECERRSRQLARHSGLGYLISQALSTNFQPLYSHFPAFSNLNLAIFQPFSTHFQAF